MKSIDGISKLLENIHFLNISQFVQDLLQAFDIPDTTIKRLLLKATNKSFKEPIYVYRRAVIIYDENIKGKDNIGTFESNLTTSCRMLIVLNKKIMVCKDFVTDELIEIRTEEIQEHIRFFTPLIFGSMDEKDLGTTIGFAELVGSLFNQLTLDENNKGIKTQIIDYILTLIYLSFSKSIIKNVELERFFKLTFASQEKNYNFLIKGFFDAIQNNEKHSKLFTNLPYWGTYYHTKNTLPNINEQSFTLTAKIICCELIEVDPEILGSLIYKLTLDGEGFSIYGHQTSSINTLKLLNPLFFDDLEKKIETNKDDKNALISIWKALLTTTFFDPTNGPGCFLSTSLNNIINLQTRIIGLCNGDVDGKIDIHNFVSIVDDELSFKLSHLTLWVSYIQYLVKIQSFKETDLLNVYKEINISKCDQLLVNWSDYCPNNGKVIIIGSPVFKGAKKISTLEKRRMQNVFGTKELGDIDYSGCWLYKAAKYIENSSSKCAFVVTNSLCQGSQVSFIWKRIYDAGCEISFAYRSFKWKNSLKFSTGVSVIIVGLVDSSYQPQVKYLFTDNLVIKTNCIGPYLVHSTRTIVKKRTRPLSTSFPLMQKGNMPYDNQNLLLTKEEKEKLILSNPFALKYIKRIVGSNEYINNIERWCLWIHPEELTDALKIPEIAERIENVKQYRLSKTDMGARKLADRPYQFREFNSTITQTLVIPSVSSENRLYIPIGFISKETIVSNLAFAIYNCEPWIFGVVSSRMHMDWIRTVCGNLETRLRYSSQLGYNTFPFPLISSEKKDKIASLVFDIIKEREIYCDQSLGKLYNLLPENLRVLHEILDKEIDSCYKDDPFLSDSERIQFLFNIYEKELK